MFLESQLDLGNPSTIAYVLCRQILEIQQTKTFLKRLLPQNDQPYCLSEREDPYNIPKPVKTLMSLHWLE